MQIGSNPHISKRSVTVRELLYLSGIDVSQSKGWAAQKERKDWTLPNTAPIDETAVIKAAFLGLGLPSVLVSSKGEIVRGGEVVKALANFINDQIALPLEFLEMFSTALEGEGDERTFSQIKNKKFFLDLSVSTIEILPSCPIEGRIIEMTEYVEGIMYHKYIDACYENRLEKTPPAMHHQVNWGDL